MHLQNNGVIEELHLILRHLHKVKSTHSVYDIVSLVEICARGLIGPQYWVDNDGNALGFGLKEVEAVHSIEDVVSLPEVYGGNLVGPQYGIDEYWHALFSDLNS